MRLIFFLFGIILISQSCGRYQKPVASYQQLVIPTIPDYSNRDHWAALPSKNDPADRTPGKLFKDEQENAAVDVFFLHPTTYSGARKADDQWNGALNDLALNLKTDNGTILHQASIFNGSGKIYAPRYRQAHYFAYFTPDSLSAQKAFDLAYSDVKLAFEYYLKNYNQGRPIIIASHSQGSTHAIRLIKDYFDGKDLQKQLVAAYLIGMPVKVDEFKNIKACETAIATNCFCTWRTFKKGHYPDWHKKGNNIAVTNPLNWTTKTTYAPDTMNEGAVLKNFDKGVTEHITDAQIHDGLLWVKKPKFFGSVLITRKNYHIADYNFFYVNVRKNAQLRAKTYLEKNR